MDVVAAVIKKNDQYLIVQRNKHKHLGLKWEFPGGKVDDGESFEEALQREIKEELNLKISIDKKIAKQAYRDDKIDILLHYYECTPVTEEIVLYEHEDYKWVYSKEMVNYDFAEADKKISKQLV